MARWESEHDGNCISTVINFAFISKGVRGKASLGGFVDGIGLGKKKRKLGENPREAGVNIPDKSGK